MCALRNLAREQDRSAFTGWDWRAERSEESATAGAAEADGASGSGSADNAPAPAQPGETGSSGTLVVRSVVDHVRALQR